MIIENGLRQKVKNTLNKNPKTKNIISNLFLKKKSVFILRPVNTGGSNNEKEHKTDRKNGKEAYMCRFNMYTKS